MSTLNEKLAQLSPAQMKALADRLRDRKAAEAGGVTRVLRDTTRFPLSFAQQRLWFLCQLEPASVAYNNPIAGRIKAPVDWRLLAEAFDALVARHEALRATFVLIDGEPVQQIASTLPLPVRYVDLAATPIERRAEEAQALLQVDAQRPFDLQSGPLVRLTVLRLEDEDYMILINAHHLVSDAWSFGVLLRELLTIQAAKSAGLPALLAPMPIQYVDFAVWQRKHLTGEVYDHLARYWRAKLAPPVSPCKLPLPRSDHAPGGVHRATLSPEMTVRVKAFARERGKTVFVVLLAAYKLLLQRYTRQGDVTVGTPVANRSRSEIEGIIGCFINTLVLRTDLSGASTFMDVVDRVGQTSVEAFAHQDMPFELLVKEIRPERDLRGNPLFQTLFSLQNAPIDTSELGEAFSIINLDAGDAKFDLTLTAMEDRGQLEFTWSYRAGAFEGEAIQAMAGHYEHLLGEALTAPNAPIERLGLMRQDELAHVLLLASGIQASGPERDYVSWFDAGVEAWPDNVALLQEEEAYSYRQLRSAADRLAIRLLAAGVGRDDLVAVVLDRSPAMITAMLGVMKAGAAFVPIDVNWPALRIADVMDVAQVRVAIAEPAHLPDPGHVMRLDPEALTTIGESGRLRARPQPSDLAYVVFTSGSSGKPKGVAVEHRHLVRYVEGVADRMALPDAAHYAAVSTLAADLAYTMIFPALVSGGCLLLASDAQMNDPRRLANWFERHPAHALKIVPSHLSALLDGPGADRMLPTALLVLGGESCSPTLLSQISTLRPGLRILNHYGPTETTVGVIAGELEAGTVSHQTAAPLGRPLGQARIYLCDDALQLSPIGVPGEICVGGSTVARGYLEQSTDDSSAFRADPYAPGKGGRLYRTGDLGRMRSDGRIEFLGRIDAQAKIRGFRVEPAEVEAAILAWPGARLAAVKAVEHGGQAALAAWVVLTQNGNSEQLLDWLAARLPAAMRPDFLQFVPTLPITANGKIDRAALQLDETLLASETRFVAPRTTTELRLAQLWEDVLDRDSIGVQDSFFDLAGNSLLAVRLIARVQREFGVATPLVSLFANPTIERFARIVANGAVDAYSGPLVPIQPLGERMPLFFVHPAGGNVLCYYQLAQLIGSDLPFYGLQADMLDIEAAQSIAAMAACYVRAIRKQQPFGPYRLGGWSMGGVVAFEIAKQLRAHGEAIAWLGVLDMPAPGGIQRADRDQVDEATALAIYARKVELFSGLNLGLDAPNLSNASAVQLAAHLLAAMRSSGLVPSEVEAPQFERFMAVQRWHNYASLNYRPEPYDGPLTVFRCKDPPPIRIEAELLRLDELYAEDSLGWAAFCELAPTIERIPGNHVQMMSSPNVDVIATIIRRALV